MIGQEPKLPIDFLFGQIQMPVAGQVHRWIEEHQARLQVAVEGARERLQVAAGRRKVGHDQRVRELPLSEGQLVYLRDYGVRGRHKLHDLWSSTVYQVVKAPPTGGLVYTVAPVSNLSQVRHVHRAALNPWAQREVVPPDLSGSVVEPPVSLEAEGELEDGDLAYVVPETPLSDCEGAVVSRPLLEAVFVPALLADGVEAVPIAEASVGLLPGSGPSSKSPSLELPDPSVVGSDHIVDLFLFCFVGLFC